MTPEDLDALWSERAITKVLLRYCRGIDRLDTELVRSCYHPDAIDEHGGFTGGVDDFIAWVSRLLRRYSSTMHFVGNMLIDVAGDVALAETYGIAYHRTYAEPFDPKGNLVTGFRYVDRFERRAGDWRIAHRIAITEWTRVDAEEHQWPVPSGMRVGQRDRTDPVWWLVPEVVRPSPE